MKPESKPATAAALSSILSALATARRSPSEAERERVPRRERLSVRTAFSLYYYVDLTRPIYFPLLLAADSLWHEADDRMELFLWCFLSGFVVFSISFLLRLREYKQIDIQGNELLFHYTFMPDRVRRFDDYDGYVYVVHRAEGGRLYLVKDHRRAESIDLGFYKDRRALLRALRQNLKELDCIDPQDKWFFSHYFFWRRYKY